MTALDTTALAALPALAPLEAALKSAEAAITAALPGANLTTVYAFLNGIVAEAATLANPDPSAVAKVKSDLAATLGDAKTLAGDFFHGLTSGLHPASKSGDVTATATVSAAPVTPAPPAPAAPAK